MKQRSRKAVFFLTIATSLWVAHGVAAQAPRKTTASATAPAGQQGETAKLARDAAAALGRGEWEEAIPLYERLVKSAPGSAEYHSKLGVAYYSTRRPHEAAPALREALKINPTLAEARDYLGASLAETGRCPEALPYLRKAISRAAERDFKKRAEVDAVRCALALDRVDDADGFLRLLHRDFPRDPESLYVAAHAYSDLSIRASQQLAITAPNSAQAHELNAESLEVQGKWDEAAMEYRKVLEQDPDLPGIHYRLGRLLMSKPSAPTTIDEARHEFEAELKISPANAGAEYVLGELARQDNNWPEAIEHFSRAAQLDASFPEALIGLGRSLIGAGRAQEAVAPLEAAVKLQPENPDPHYQLALAYRLAGRRDDALREFAVRQQLIDKMHAAEKEHAGAAKESPQPQPQ